MLAAGTLGSTEILLRSRERYAAGNAPLPGMPRIRRHPALSSHNDEMRWRRQIGKRVDGRHHALAFIA